MSDKNGIEIDYCPQCRGVWLDRGELDKIIERSATASYATPPQQPAYGGQAQYSNHPQNHHGQQQYYPQHNQYSQHHHKKREGFWGELFDFD
jgi:Zn-finger nucleic acid-binding protein